MKSATVAVLVAAILNTAFAAPPNYGDRPQDSVDTPSYQKPGASPAPVQNGPSGQPGLPPIAVLPSQQFQPLVDILHLSPQNLGKLGDILNYFQNGKGKVPGDLTGVVTKLLGLGDDDAVKRVLETLLHICTKGDSGGDGSKLNPNEPWEPTGDGSKTPSGDDSKKPTDDGSKTPDTTGGDSKTPTGDGSKTPDTTGGDSKTPTGDSKTPTGDGDGDGSKTPTGDDSKTPTGDESKIPTGNESKTPTGDESKTPAGDDSQNPDGLTRTGNGNKSVTPAVPPTETSSTNTSKLTPPSQGAPPSLCSLIADILHLPEDLVQKILIALGLGTGKGPLANLTNSLPAELTAPGGLLGPLKGASGGAVKQTSGLAGGLRPARRGLKDIGGGVTGIAGQPGGVCPSKGL